LRALLLPLLLIGLTPARSSQPTGPQAHQPAVTAIVAGLLSRMHYRELPLDDAMSHCWLDSYVDALDPYRSYFTATDIASLQRYDTELDDLTNSGLPDISPAWTIYNTWRSRARQRVEWTRAALATDPDLTNTETIELDREDAPWPADEAALQDLWRRELEDDWLRLVLADEPADDVRDRMQQRMDRLEKNADAFEPDDILELYLSSLAGCYDPHTVYLKPFSAEDFAIETQGSLEGIGAALRIDEDMVMVSEIIAGGPAQLSGQIKAEDHIVAVAEGTDGEWVDVIGMRLDHVVQLIRGPKGTTVRLEILPADAVDGSDKKRITLVRDRIDLDQVDPTVDVREVADPDGSVRRIAHIEVPAFVGEVDPDAGEPRPSTTQQVDALLRQHQDVDAVVIDLRANGGGLLDEAVSLTGLFIDKGNVVRIRDGLGRIEQLDDETAGASWTGPLVVLTSPYSASASEIFTGALQDHGRALVVGSSTTYGKGSVQTVLPLDDSLARLMPSTLGQNLAGALKLTFAQYYLPGGRSTQSEGVPSDIVLPSPFDVRVERDGDRPHALPADAIQPARFKPAHDLEPLVAGLRARSKARVAVEPRFDAMQEWGQELEAIDKENAAALDLAERKAELARRKARREQIDEILGDDDDPVLDEALAISADLVEQLGS